MVKKILRGILTGIIWTLSILGVLLLITAVVAICINDPKVLFVIIPMVVLALAIFARDLIDDNHYDPKDYVSVPIFMAPNTYIYKGNWNNSEEYNKMDAIRASDNNVYICNIPNIGLDPLDNRYDIHFESPPWEKVVNYKLEERFVGENQNGIEVVCTKD